MTNFSMFLFCYVRYVSSLSSLVWGSHNCFLFHSLKLFVHSLSLTAPKHIKRKHVFQRDKIWKNHPQISLLQYCAQYHAGIMPFPYFMGIMPGIMPAHVWSFIFIIHFSRCSSIFTLSSSQWRTFQIMYQNLKKLDILALP